MRTPAIGVPENVVTASYVVMPSRVTETIGTLLVVEMLETATGTPLGAQGPREGCRISRSRVHAKRRNTVRISGGSGLQRCRRGNPMTWESCIARLEDRGRQFHGAAIGRLTVKLDFEVVRRAMERRAWPLPSRAQTQRVARIVHKMREKKAKRRPTMSPKEIDRLRKHVSSLPIDKEPTKATKEARARLDEAERIRDKH
jgi:hypothetical protein